MKATDSGFADKFRYIVKPSFSPPFSLPIFLDKAASAAALMDLIGAADRGEEDSASGSRVVVVAGFGHGSFGQFVCGVVCS
ncbi:hypothetical protein ZWY2020_016089 [Hordeum vulgare]|nr:hypothetical protein ZWY2020_016089 [Hordeum vulgare]